MRRWVLAAVLVVALAGNIYAADVLQEEAGIFAAAGTAHVSEQSLFYAENIRFRKFFAANGQKCRPFPDKTRKQSARFAKNEIIAIAGKRIFCSPCI